MMQDFCIKQFEKNIVIKFDTADKKKGQNEHDGMAGCLFDEIISRDVIQHGSDKSILIVCLLCIAQKLFESCATVRALAKFIYRLWVRSIHWSRSL